MIPVRRPSQLAAHASAAALPAAVAPSGETSAFSEAGKERLGPALRLTLEILRPDWWLLALTAVVLVATIATTLLFPICIGNVFDVVRAHGPAAGAGPAAAAAASTGPGLPSLFTRAAVSAAPAPFRRVLLELCASLVASAAGNAAVAYLAPLVGERFGVRLRKRLMAEVLAKEQPFFDAMPRGDLVARLTLDVATLQATLADYVGQRGFRSLFEVLGAMAVIATKSPGLAGVALLVTPALSRALRSLVVRSADLSYRRQALAAEALEFASSRLAAVSTVQVYGAAERETARFAALCGQGYELARQYATFQGVVEGAGRLAVNVGSVALLGLGGMLVLQGKMSVGSLLATLVMNLFISVGMASVAASLGEVGKAVGALERIAELIDTPTDSGDALPAAAAEEGAGGTGRSGSGAGASASGGAVAFRGVGFRYPGRQDWALRGLDLEVPAGATLALVGPSGGGKSTVVALLTGQYRASEGSILVDGEPLPPGGEALDLVRARMGAVFQAPMLMSGSVADQIRFGKPDASLYEVATAAAAANADVFIRQLPEGYATDIGERGQTLSGGQKQRLAIARALVRQPKILVLDEITSALDVESEMAIDATLRALHGCTKIIIAHRLSTIRSADCIAVVQGGRVVETGTHSELMAARGQYARMLATAELGGADWVAAAGARGGAIAAAEEEPAEEPRLATSTS